jgi:hypothetical protein
MHASLDPVRVLGQFLPSRLSAPLMQIAGELLAQDVT